jgi:hypothetical protein
MTADSGKTSGYLTCDADGPCNHRGGRATRCAPLVTCDDEDAGAELVTPLQSRRA